MDKEKMILVDDFTVKQFEMMEMDVNKFTEKKSGLTYLSWASAWDEFLKIFPNATYSIKKDNEGNAFFGNAKMGYMVYTTITVMGRSREMWLFVKDGANKSLKDDAYEYQGKYKMKTVEAINMFDVNTCIMRCFTKNMAMFGLGLYIYIGEDIPKEIDEEIKVKKVAYIPLKVEEEKPHETTKDTPKESSGDPKEKVTMITDKQIKRIHILFKDSIANKENLYDFYRIKTCKELNEEDAKSLISNLVGIKNDSKGNITQIQIGQMSLLLKQKGFSRKGLLEKNGIKTLDDMTCLKAHEIMIGLRKLVDKK